MGERKCHSLQENKALNKTSSNALCLDDYSTAVEGTLASIDIASGTLTLSPGESSIASEPLLVQSSAGRLRRLLCLTCTLPSTITSRWLRTCSDGLAYCSKESNQGYASPPCSVAPVTARLRQPAATATSTTSAAASSASPRAKSSYSTSAEKAK